MKINDAMLNPGPDIYYDKSFRDTLEAHMLFFRASSKTRTMDVEPHRATIYEADLFGYLSERNLNPSQFWLIMRISGMFSPHEFGKDTATLLVPASDEVEAIRQSFVATGLIAM